MEKLTQKEVEDLNFLRGLDRIIIPKEFTYWCHSTMYKPIEDCSTQSDKRCWNEIPTNNFTLKKEMSFVGRIQRVNSALDYGNLPTITYANTASSLPFQIRVLQPKHEYVTSLYPDPNVQKQHYFSERGLGDGRHPKLPNKTDLYVFSFAQKDDVSDQDIDIVYCVSKRDISIIADLVRKIIKEGNVGYNKNVNIINNRAFENNVPTIIERSTNYSRFFDTKIVDKVRKDQLIMEAGYKQDYNKLIKRNKR